MPVHGGKEQKTQSGAASTAQKTFCARRRRPPVPLSRKPAHAARPAAGDTTLFIQRESARYDGDTAIKLYLREIGQVKLLTPQEEIELAARIKKGDKKAREQMIKANLRLVVKIARDYEGIGLPLLDLISEGNIGLMKAVERFDPAKGGKLSTYGSWWIKQSIKRALANQSKTIRLPVHLVDKISKMRRTGDEVAGGTGPRADRRGAGRGTGHHRRARAADAAWPPSGPPRSTRPSATRIRTISPRWSRTKAPPRPTRSSKTRPSPACCRRWSSTSTTREATILRYRFGLDGGTEKTLEEVGEKFGVTRERVRQIQNLALRKLRKMIEKLESTKPKNN